MEYKDIVDLLENTDITNRDLLNENIDEELLTEAAWSQYSNKLKELEIDLNDVNSAINQLYDLLKVRMKLNTVILEVRNINEQFKLLERENDLDNVIEILGSIESHAKRFEALTKFGMDDYRQIIKILPSYLHTLDQTYALIKNIAVKIPAIRKMQKGKRFFKNAADAVTRLFK